MRRRWWPLSFRWRIALTILCLELGMVALVLMVTLRHSYETARAELAAADRQAVAMFRDLARLALVDDELGNIQAYFEETQARGRLRQADLIDLSGRVLASSDPRRIGTFLVDAGILLFGATVLFQLVTLPVEFDASNRAKAVLAQTGIVSNQDEADGVSKVLGAAAMTYVAAALTAIATLLYLLSRQPDKGST